MKGKKDLKQLIPWIEKACNENLFPGLLGWKDKKEKTFFVTWVHKSSDDWKKSKSAVFEAWAINKHKLVGKDDRDLKAAFRNALRSKKNNLQEISKSRNERTWKIISDGANSTTSSNKVKKTKQRKTNKNNTNCSETLTSINTVSMQSTSSACSANSYNSMIPNEVPLPSYQTLLHVSPPTPPKQHTDVYLETLASQEELFHLQEEIMNLAQPSSFSDIYRVPSPPILPASPPSPSSFFDVFNEADKNTPQTIDSAEDISNLDFLLQSNLKKNKEQIVPKSQLDWNFHGINPIMNFDQNQFPKETENQQTNQQLLEQELCNFTDFFTW